MKLPCALLFLTPTLAGCGAGGGETGCSPTTFAFSAVADQGSTTPDHSAKAPGNQQKFTAFAGALSGPGCATPAVMGPAPARWTTSQPTALQVSSAHDDSNGLVTCQAATDGKAMLTASYTQGKIIETSTTTVSCQ